MIRYRIMIAALRGAGLDCPAARFAAYGMLETGEHFGVVVKHLAVYLGLREDVMLREFDALCWPRPAAARFSEIIKEVLKIESGIYA